MCLLLVLGLALGRTSDSAALPDDPAARGVDAFVEMPSEVVAGTTLRVNVRTFGFRTAVDPEPLGHALVAAAWSEGDPSPVEVETDDRGAGTIELRVPSGKKETAELALKVRVGNHARTRTFQVRREPRFELTLSAPRTEVRAGSDLPVWVTVRDRATGDASADTNVSVSLNEGGVVRQSFPLRTDASGSATAVIPIPETEAPTLDWTIRAATTTEDGTDATLEVRQAEDVPAKPTLKATFEAHQVVAGASTSAHVSLVDAANDPIEDAKLQYIVTDKPEKETTDDDWRASKETRTDALGAAVIPVAVPTVGFAKAWGVHVRTLAAGRFYTADDRFDVVERAAPTVRVLPEGGAIVPGLAQRLLVTAKDGAGAPIAATFDVKGDGLAERITTDAHGRAEITWRVPLDVGAKRDIGPCSGFVAATVRVTAAASAPQVLIDAGPTPACVVVQRDESARVEIGSPIARAGDAVPVTLAMVVGERDVRTKPADKLPVSLSVSSVADAASSLVWMLGAAGNATIPETRGGVFRVTARVPRADRPALEGSAMILVKPRVLPKLSVRVDGGRPTPGGDVDVAATLTDEAGAPLEGSVMGVVFDRTSLDTGGIPPELDTRLRLCDAARIEPAECDAALSGDPSELPVLRASMERTMGGGVEVSNDPGASSKREMQETFATVLKNLEGAVFEATNEPGRLRDVLRKGTKGDELNPEVMTLVTSVLETPPLTPGGEPFTLDDLVAVDPQVTYDNVARRVARLKMFRVLQKVREFRGQHALDPSEPVLADPNGILRRLLVAEGLDGAPNMSALVDPWGGAMEFVKSRGPGLPFLSPVPGWELHVAGPDGRIGTADDLSDPFVRVLRSGSPYALAMGEDKIVDAKLDMEVADATVEAWSGLLNQFTGTELGSGSGVGTGFGRLGGSHRSGAPSVRMGATSVTRSHGAYVLSAPVRTDGHGTAHLHLTLGADETTYRILAVAMPDKAGPAAGYVDVPVTLPLSVRVQAGEGWIAGDTVEVKVKVTNRSDAPVHATVKITPGGAAALGRDETGAREVDVASRHASWLRFRIAARDEGDAILTATVDAGPRGSDRVEHHVDVAPNGRHASLSRARWVTGEETIPLVESDGDRTITGRATLVADAGVEPSLLGALDALEPDHLTNEDAVLDAADAYARLARALATSRPDAAARADRLRERSLGRFAALAQKEDNPEGRYRRARAIAGTLAPVIASISPDLPDCPGDGTSGERALVSSVEAEPPPVDGGVPACWDAVASNAMRSVGERDDVVALGRIVLAFAGRPHRSRLALAAADDLGKRMTLTPSGEISFPSGQRNDRRGRAVVYAAFLRATSIGWRGAASVDALLGWLLVQRAPDGGFGSALATRAAVEALTAMTGTDGHVDLTYEELSRGGDLLHSGGLTGASASVSLDGGTVAVRIRPRGARSGVLVRVEQSALVRFDGTDDVTSPISASVRWPDAPVAETTATLEVRFGRTTNDDHDLVMRLPLPPGATLAETVQGVRPVDGALIVFGSTARALPLEIPLRFSLAGELEIPDTVVRSKEDAEMVGHVPSRWLAVDPAR